MFPFSIKTSLNKDKKGTREYRLTAKIPDAVLKMIIDEKTFSCFSEIEEHLARMLENDLLKELKDEILLSKEFRKKIIKRTVEKISKDLLTNNN